MWPAVFLQPRSVRFHPRGALLNCGGSGDGTYTAQPQAVFVSGSSCPLLLFVASDRLAESINGGRSAIPKSRRLSRVHRLHAHHTTNQRAGFTALAQTASLPFCSDGFGGVAPPKTPSTRHMERKTGLSLAPRPLLDLPPRHLRRRPFGSRVGLGPRMLLRRASRVLRPSVLVVRGTAHLPQFQVF